MRFFVSLRMDIGKTKIGDKGEGNGSVFSIDNIDGKVCLLYSVVRFFRYLYPESEFVHLLRSPRTVSQPGGPVRQPYLTYRPARLHRLAESIPWNRFLGSLNVYKFGHC
jgi:hypothetical protein